MNLVVHRFENLLRPVTLGVFLGRHVPPPAIFALQVIFNEVAPKLDILHLFVVPMLKVFVRLKITSRIS